MVVCYYSNAASATPIGMETTARLVVAPRSIDEDEMNTPEEWRDQAASELFEAILRLESVDEASAFFRDLCTLGELHDLAQRWAVVRMLDVGMHYAEFSRQTGASTATITRIAQWLHHGEGGYTKALERLKTQGRTTAKAGQGR